MAYIVMALYDLVGIGQLAVDVPVLGALEARGLRERRAVVVVEERAHGVVVARALVALDDAAAGRAWEGRGGARREAL